MILLLARNIENITYFLDKIFTNEQKKNHKKDLEDNEIIENDNENENNYNDIQTCNITILDYIIRFFSICMYH